MAEGKMPASGAGDLDGGLVLLQAGGAGTYQQPLGVVSFHDLPHDLRRRLVAGAGRAAVGGVQAVVLAPLHDQGDAARHFLNITGHPSLAVPEGVSRHLFGGVSPPGGHAGYYPVAVGRNDYAARDATGDASGLRASASRLKEDGGRVLDGTAIPHQVPADMRGRLFELTNGPPARVERSGELSLDAAAAALVLRLQELGIGTNGFGSVADNAAPMGEPLLGALGLDLDANGLASVGESSALLGDLEPAPNKAVLPVPGDAPYAVQVRIDKPVGVNFKAGDSIGMAAKAAGTDAGPELGHHGGGKNGDLSVSAVLSIATASSAVTAVATGAVTPAVAFGFFAILIGAVSLVMATVRGA